LKITADEIIGG